MRLRPARPDELPAIRSLVFGITATYGFAPEPEAADYDLYGGSQDYFRRGSLLEVLEDDSAGLAAVLGVLDRGGGTLELRKLYLRPEHHGQGWGRRLLERALSFARERGYQRVTLETSTRLEAANRLYEANGFRVLAERNRSPACDRRLVLDL